MPDKPTSLFTLRPLEKADLEVVTQWFHDVADLASFDRASRIPLNLCATENAWGQAIDLVNENGKCWFAIVSGTNQIIGIIGLEGFASPNRDAVLPLFIDKSMRRNGIGLRATALVIDFAFRQLGLHRVTSYYRADNVRSGELTQQIGFEIEGRMRQAWFAEGQHFDMIVVGLLRDGWDERRDALAQEMSSETTVAFCDTVSSDWAWPPNMSDTN